MASEQAGWFSYARYLFPFIWMVYLIYPVSLLLEQPVLEMWTGFTLLTVFVAAYLAAFVLRRIGIVMLFAMLLIAGFFAFYYDPALLFLGCYAIPIAGHLPSQRQFFIAMSLMIVLILAVILTHAASFQGIKLFNELPALLFMILFPVGMRVAAKAKELKVKLGSANDEIARLIQNEERQRISRDLHDTLGHTLSLITLKSELAEKLLMKNPERAAQEVKDIQTTARAALKQVRELVSGMNAVSLQEALRHADQLLAAAGIELTVKGDCTDVQVSPLIQNMLGLCLREAVTNVVKHSGAGKCIIELKHGPANVVLSVQDNGHGFEAGSEKAASGGRGLIGIKDRLDLVDGKLAVRSAAGEGTQLVITIPRVARTQEGGQEDESHYR